MTLPYYKRYTRDILDGTVGMGFELKTAYSFILDLIYHHNGSLADEPRYIAGQLECSVRKWTSIREKLIDLDKIQISGGFVTNYRAVSELETLGKFQDKQKINAQKPRFNEASRENLAKPKPSHTDTDTDTDTEIPKGIIGTSDKRQFVQQVYSAWNGLAHEFGLSKVKTNLPNAERAKSVLRRLSECQGNESLIFDALQNIPHNDHWIGRSKSQWYIKFDWVFGSPKNFRKVLEHEPVSQNIQNSNNAQRGPQSSGLAGSVERSLNQIAQQAHDGDGFDQDGFGGSQPSIPAIFIGDGSGDS